MFEHFEFLVFSEEKASLNQNNPPFLGLEFVTYKLIIRHEAQISCQ